VGIYQVPSKSGTTSAWLNALTRSTNPTILKTQIKAIALSQRYRKANSVNIASIELTKSPHAVQKAKDSGKFGLVTLGTKKVNPIYLTTCGAIKIISATCAAFVLSHGDITHLAKSEKAKMLIANWVKKTLKVSIVPSPLMMLLSLKTYSDLSVINLGVYTHL
jgi:hypothetical protein